MNAYTKRKNEKATDCTKRDWEYSCLPNDDSSFIIRKSSNNLFGLSLSLHRQNLNMFLNLKWMIESLLLQNAAFSMKKWIWENDWNLSFRWFNLNADFLCINNLNLRARMWCMYKFRIKTVTAIYIFIDQVICIVFWWK